MAAKEVDFSGEARESVRRSVGVLASAVRRPGEKGPGHPGGGRELPGEPVWVPERRHNTPFETELPGEPDVELPGEPDVPLPDEKPRGSPRRPIR